MPTSEPVIATFPTNRRWLWLGMPTREEALFTLIMGVVVTMVLILSWQPDRPVASIAATVGLFGLLIGLRWLFGLACALPHLLAPPVTVSADGLRWGSRHYAWAALDGVRVVQAPSQSISLSGREVYSVIHQKRPILTLDRHRHDYRRLANLIVDHLTAYHAPHFHAELAAGRTLKFGPMSLTATHFQAKQRRFQRTDITYLETAYIVTWAYLSGDPRALLLGHFIMNDWQQQPPPPLGGDWYAVGYFPPTDVEFYRHGLEVTPDGSPATFYPWVWVDLVQADGQVVLRYEGQPIVQSSLEWADYLMPDLQNIMATIQRYHDAMPRLAAGETLDFGEVQLGAERMVVPVTGQVIERERVRHVAFHEQGATLYDTHWTPILDLDRQRLSDWPLLSNLLSPWGQPFAL